MTNFFYSFFSCNFVGLRDLAVGILCCRELSTELSCEKSDLDIECMFLHAETVMMKNEISAEVICKNHLGNRDTVV